MCASRVRGAQASCRVRPSFRGRRLMLNQSSGLSRLVFPVVPAVEVFPIDASVGGDGILAKSTIKTVQDLKGQKVAVNQGSVSEWFLAQVLKKNGLSLSDVTEQNMKSGEAGAAFVAGQVDVAVTWEPWLSKAKARADG